MEQSKRREYRNAFISLKLGCENSLEYSVKFTLDAQQFYWMNDGDDKDCHGVPVHIHIFREKVCYWIHNLMMFIWYSYE